MTRLYFYGDRGTKFRCIRARRFPRFWQIAIRVNDQIHIHGLEIFAHIGVPDEERGTTQRLKFYLTLWPRRQTNDLNDEIAQTVDYAAVCAAVKHFVEARRDKLIETLADALASHLFATFEIHRVAVELRKYILPEVEFVSVTVTRERSQE